jgi:hypothetical protein
MTDRKAAMPKLVDEINELVKLRPALERLVELRAGVEFMLRHMAEPGVVSLPEGIDLAVGRRRLKRALGVISGAILAVEAGLAAHDERV